MRFWDSSAIVPLLVAQEGSALADAWLAEDRQLAVWTLTGVEVVSALRRLHRDGVLAEAQARRAETRADHLLAASHRVVDVDAVGAAAKRLLRLHPLRAADALQLGAALEWCGTRPAGRVLHTLDRRLGVAALREGFHVLPPPGD